MIKVVSTFVAGNLLGYSQQTCLDFRRVVEPTARSVSPITPPEFKYVTACRISRQYAECQH